MTISPLHLHLPLRACLVLPLAGLWAGPMALANEVSKLEGTGATEATEAPAAGEQPKLFIREFRIVGAQALPRIEVEEAVYPFLGPGRTFEDVEKARAALEKTYRDKGFKATQVVIPEQTGRGGIVLLQTYEGRVGALRVKGAQYFLPSRIKQQARSMAEGKVINFNDVTRDVVALNQSADRTVDPKLTPTGEPGVFDIDLNVKDKLPLHGRLDLNNRYSVNTTPLRLNASVSYGNLWQRGHSVGASFQLSPEDPSEVKVFSGFYTWRFQEVDWFSLLFTGTKQDSNVSTLGSSAVAGKGDILGLRGVFTLPAAESFFHSLSAGFDYKHFNQSLFAGGTNDVIPISYYPLSATWDGTWVHRRDKDVRGTTEMSAGVTMNVRGLGSTVASLDRNRYGSDGNFIYFRGDVSHTHKLPRNWELFGRVHGQVSDQPLVNSEQFAGGGIDTSRAYYEAEVLGDNGIFGTVELRTPSLLRDIKKDGDPKNPDDKTGDEWRFYGFFDTGTVKLIDPLPEQESSFKLTSIGLGTELHFRKHLHAVAELALPLTSSSETELHHPRVNFRMWADF
jgi:hemolysin activation/secretion protein